MSTTSNKYPFFDLSEIVPEYDFHYKNYKPLNPVKAGNSVPDFNLSAGFSRWQRFYNGAPTHGPAQVKQLLNAPLVIAFYSGEWNDYGTEHLKQLNAIQYEIKANGGNLLIINADDKSAELEKTVWENNLSLNFYYDRDNELAEKFRVYSEENPTWSTYAGIDVNVPLLATYVIDPSKHIVYQHIDKELTGTFYADDILSAVHEAAFILNHKRSA